MDINLKKDVFISNDRQNIIVMLHYVKNVLGIDEAERWNFIGKEVLCVPPANYEEVLLKGKQYAVDNNLPVCWLDYQKSVRPINCCDIGYALLPETKIPGEDLKEYKDKHYWGLYRDHTPKTILEYFDAMKEYLNVDELYLSTNLADKAMMISPASLDYDKMSELLNEFVKEYGYGPFEEIHSLTFTGEYNKEPIATKSK